ncbi:MAG: thermonuclease family protein [Rhodospirillaceae bacterium]
MTPQLSTRADSSALVGLILQLVTTTACAFSGVVVGVHDGDTLTVLVEQTPVKVRLAEIDAPELRQPFGTRSRQSLAALCFKTQASVRQIGRDQYGRAIGYVLCNGTDANAEQVRRGMAWVYDKYSRPDSPLYRLQEGASDAQLGLWADGHRVAPWVWRGNRH